MIQIGDHREAIGQRPIGQLTRYAQLMAGVVGASTHTVEAPAIIDGMRQIVLQRGERRQQQHNQRPNGDRRGARERQSFDRGRRLCVVVVTTTTAAAPLGAFLVVVSSE